MSSITFHLDTEWQRYFPIGFFTAHHRFDQGCIHRPAGFPADQILMVLEGTGYVHCQGQTYPLKRGSAFFVGRNVPVDYEGDGALITAFLTFRGSCVPSLLSYYGCSDFLFYDTFPTETFANEIRYITDRYNEGCERGELCSRVLSFVVSFFEHKSKRVSCSEEAASYLRQQFRRKLTLSEIASACHCSVSKLCHEFKQQYGCTVIAYLLRVRLQYARDLLLTEPERTVKEAAALGGFEDVGYFCRVYKQHFGKTPTSDRQTTTHTDSE